MNRTPAILAMARTFEDVDFQNSDAGITSQQLAVGVSYRFGR